MLLLLPYAFISDYCTDFSGALLFCSTKAFKKVRIAIYTGSLAPADFNGAVFTFQKLT